MARKPTAQKARKKTTPKEGKVTSKEENETFKEEKVSFRDETVTLKEEMKALRAESATLADKLAETERRLDDSGIQRHAHHHWHTRHRALLH